MTQQEQFEADYLAAFPYMELFLLRNDDGDYVCLDIKDAYVVWLQQAKRHEAEIAELVGALKAVPMAEGPKESKNSHTGMPMCPVCKTWWHSYEKARNHNPECALNNAIAKYGVKK